MTRSDSSDPTFMIEASGKLKWGSGGASLDTELQRNGSGNLKLTTGHISAAGGFGTSNSTTATTLGAVVRRMEIFNITGASLGFIPIYDSIT